MSAEHETVARQMRAKARRGWYIGDEASLEKYGARRVLRAHSTPELALSLTLSRDRMHHSVGWWRNAEYEFCWHLSMGVKDARALLGGQAGWDSYGFEEIPREEVRYWSRLIFGEHVDKLWTEPGGTDPRLLRQEQIDHAKFIHQRLFLDPETKEPFIPKGEVYTLTRWIDGLTPAKVDR